MRLLNIISLLFLSLSLFGQWISYDSVGTSVNAISKISFPNTTVGYAIGRENGAIYKTIYKANDGAGSWNNLNYPTINNPDIQSIHFVDSLTGFLSVRESQGANLIMNVYKTTNGAQSWTDLSSSTTFFTGNGASSVHFISTDTGFLSVGNQIFKTVNSGQSWSIDTLNGMYIDIRHIDFWTEQYGIAGGWDGTFAYTGVLFFTNDGGDTWNEVTIPQFNTSIADVQRVGSTHLFALSGGTGSFIPPYLFRSINSGTSWDTLNLNQYKVDVNDNFNALFFQDENTGYIGTSKGYILKTTDAGQTWALDYSFNAPNPRVVDIDFSGNVGYAFSTSGKIAKIDLNTAIQDIQPIHTIVGFPNPTVGIYTLNLEGTPAKSIKIYNTEGELFFKLPSPMTHQTINTQNWPLGIYIGIVETEKGMLHYFKLQKS